MNAESRNPGRGMARRARSPSRHLRVLLATALGACLAAPLTAQTPPRMWAAQTGPDQVTLVWDSVPGASEYRVYLGAPGAAAPAPGSRLSAGTRRTIVNGVDRLSSGAYLAAVAADGRVIQQAPFNQVTPVTTFGLVAAPASVTAQATGGSEVALSWDPVPGATAFFIGRAVGGSGFRPLCDVCSTATPFVDRSARAGLEHTYTVSAIFPNGISRRVTSNKVTPGGTAVATTGQAAAAPVTSSTTATTAPTSSTVTSTTSTTTHTATAVTTSPTTATTTPLGTAGTIAGTIATNAGTTTSTSPTSTQGAIAGVISDVAGTVAGRLDGVSRAVGVSAAVAGPGAVRVTWQPSPTAGVTEYQVKRIVNPTLSQAALPGTWPVVNTVPASTLDYTDAFFPVTMFASGPVSVSYSIVASKSGAYSLDAVTPAVIVQPPVVTSPVTSTAPTTCKLDYQRADNMWAPFGQPQGALGTESISQTPGQDKVFTTDWKYEKTRNDGSNYYGSHLRIATNSTTRTIRLQLRSLTLTGLIVWARTGADTFWIRLDPGKTLQFQADLMEVFCEN